MNKVRRILLRLFFPIMVLFSKIEIITGTLPKKFKSDLSLKVEEGDILVSFIKWNFLNPFIKGHFSHAAMYVGNGEIVEAIGTGVQKVSLKNFCLTKDEVVLLRAKDFYSTGKALASQIALSFLGRPYDYIFCSSLDAFYCAELVYRSLKQADSFWGFVPREVFGEETILPQDFVDAKEYFKTILDSREY